jgi:acetolactate synthase small subunit
MSTLSYAILATNQRRLLARLCVLFAQRGVDVQSITTGPYGSDGMRWIYLTVAEPMRTSQQNLMKNISRLVEVVTLTELDPETCQLRQRLLAKATCVAQGD